MIVNSTLPGLAFSRNIDFIVFTLLFLVVLLTSIILSKTKTPKPSLIKIRFSKSLFILLLALELYFIYILNGKSFSLDVAFARLYRFEAISNLGLLKISTLFFYMFTIMLSAKIELLNLHKTFLPQCELKYLRALLITALVVYVMKDIYSGARGSTLNFIAFYLAGKTYINRSYFSLRKILSTDTFITIVLLSGAIVFLTINRTGSSEFIGRLIYDSLLIKFVGNLEVAMQLLAGDLLVSNGWNSGYISTKNIQWNTNTLSVIAFLPVLEAITKLFVDISSADSTYFKVYEKFPFNSASYLFYMLIGGLPSVILCTTIIFIIRKASGLSASVNLFSYATLFYFGFTSFTSLPIVNIPFVLIPAFAVFFKYFISYEENNATR